MNIGKYLKHKGNSFINILHRLKMQHSSSYLSDVLNMTVDIRNIPKARGKLRLLQEIDLELLKVFDAFCRKRDFRYFLSFGTLLGAVRHGGYIPWDDDVDLFVFKEEYDQIRAALEDAFNGTGFCLYGVERCRFDDMTLRISHNDFPQMNLDLFYLYPSTLEGLIDEQTFRRANRYRKETLGYYRWTLSDEENRESLSKFRQIVDCRYGEIIGECSPNDARSFVNDIVCTPRLFPRDMILPLSDVEFDGCKFPAPNKINDMLDLIYGDWMKFPLRFDHHGSDMLGFSMDQALKMKAHLRSCVVAGRFL